MNLVHTSSRRGTRKHIPPRWLTCLVLSAICCISAFAAPPLVKPARPKLRRVPNPDEWSFVCKNLVQSGFQSSIVDASASNRNASQCGDAHRMEWWKSTTDLCWTCGDAQPKGADVCRNPPLQVFHTLLDTAFPRAWHSNLLAIKAFLLTQDLRHARMVLWVTDVDGVQLNAEAAQLFSEFARVIEVHQLWWPELVWDTPIESHPFFSSPAALHVHAPSGPYHDILRLLVLHKYGGTWLDAGALLTQDIGVLSARLGLQWQAVWPHSRDVMLTMQRKGALSASMLQLLGNTSACLDEASVIHHLQSLCSNASIPATPTPALHTLSHLLRTCLPHLAMQRVPSTPANLLHTLPVSWFDPTHDQCMLSTGASRRRRLGQLSRQQHQSTEAGKPGAVPGQQPQEPTWSSKELRRYRAAAQQYLAARMWYIDLDPAYAHGQQSELHDLYEKVLDTYFGRCRRWDCMPLESVSLHQLFKEATLRAVKKKRGSAGVAV